MAKHALLSASGAHRWLLCTPSAQLEQKFPASTSAYAEEGTVAHALAELTTRYFLGELDEVSYENQIKSEFEPNSYYNAEMRECAVAYGRGQAFTESLEEKQAACEKVIARYLASDRDTRTELQPSAALIRQLKQRKGFTNATRNNIRVYRCVAGYTIEMAGRNGAKAKSELIRLPGTK